MRSAEIATKALKRTVLAAALCAGTITAASATPLDFTWNPSVTGNTTAGMFTADRFGLNDFATIHIPTNLSTPGAVVEHGFLEYSGFTLDTVPVSTVHTSGAGGYGIYESFSATSHLAPCSGGLCGAFDTITVSTFLYSTKNGLASYKFPGPTHDPVIHLPTGAHPVLLATGSGPLPNSVVPNFADIKAGVPGASVGVKFVPNPAEAAFFVSPPASFILSLEQVFTNTLGVIVTLPKNCGKNGTVPCTVEIRGGGGDGDFLKIKVPEPASLLLLGVGVGAIGLARRRRTV